MILFKPKKPVDQRSEPTLSEPEGVGDLGQFFDECIEPKNDSYVSLMDIWQRYKVWCERNRFAPIAYPLFSEDFQKLALELVGHINIQYRGAHFFLKDTMLKLDRG